MVRKTPQAMPGIQDRGSESSPAPASSPAGPECSCPPQSRPRRRDSEDSPDLQKGDLSAGRQEGSGSWPLPPGAYGRLLSSVGCVPRCGCCPLPGRLHGPGVWLCALYIPALGLHGLGLYTGMHMHMVHPQGHALPPFITISGLRSVKSGKTTTLPPTGRALIQKKKKNRKYMLTRLWKI